VKKVLKTERRLQTGGDKKTAAAIEAMKLRSEEAKKAVLYCFEIGITKISDACAYAGMSVDWYNDHVKAEPSFVDLIEKAKAKRKALALRRILEAGETSWQAQAWYLERVHSEEYALKQRAEISGKENGPLLFQLIPAPIAAHATMATETIAEPQGTETNANGPDPTH
jgi:hypothetical protein